MSDQTVSRQNFTEIRAGLGYIRGQCATELFTAGISINGLGNLMYTNVTSPCLAQDHAEALMTAVQALGSRVEQMSRDIEQAADQLLEVLDKAEGES